MVNVILPMIPQHKIYCEPFFGGGALFWAKGPSYLETINDTNKNVVNFLEVLQKQYADLKLMIENSLFSETLFWEAYRIYCHPAGSGKVKRAWAFWMCSNFSFAAKIGGGIKFSNGSNGTHPGRLMHKKKADFTEQLFDRLKYVHISCRDALVVIPQRDSLESFFYLDPPYIGADMGHYKGYSLQQFEALLQLISNIKGKFILSNYPSDILTQYSIANNWCAFKLDMRLSAGHHTLGHRRKKEVLVINFEPHNLFTNHSIILPEFNEISAIRVSNSF